MRRRVWVIQRLEKWGWQDQHRFVTSNARDIEQWYYELEGCFIMTYRILAYTVEVPVVS